MEFEFVGLYPCYGKKDKQIVATCHVYDKTSKQDIRGIKVFCKKNYVFVTMPTCTAYDFDEKKPVTYPTIGYSSKSDDDALKNFVREQAIKEFRKINLPDNLPETRKEYHQLLKESSLAEEIKPSNNDKSVYMRK